MRQLPNRSKAQKVIEGSQHPTRENTSGLVLCGGKGTRFGSRKETFKYRGLTLLEHAIRAVDPLVATIGLAIGDQTERDWPDVELVPDRVPDIGPIAGIHAGLEWLESDWLLVVPVDVPFMTTEFLAALVRKTRHGDAAVVARDRQDRVHALCCLLHKSTLQMVHDSIRRKQYAIKHLLREMDNVRYVTFPDERLRNVNRPSDLG